ncbi:hypothetical protein LZ32DRAFT_694432 [Colletotrichum eremochloae]|nr:hypothetical protein LZ32DRAFT_694432 [Colletotrichum eremochloae]
MPVRDKSVAGVGPNGPSFGYDRLAVLEGYSRKQASTVIDWAAETSLDASSSLAPADIVSGSVTAKVNLPPRGVVLVGATGFLGRHLFNIIRKSTITRIHYIATRNPPSFSSSYPFADLEVRISRGDLGAPRLCLSAADAAPIFV